MNETPVFKSKDEKIDFWIALAVITFFGLLFWWAMGKNVTLPSLDKIVEEASVAVVDEGPDSDGDGILNANDLCPDLAGVESNNGCPLDSDGDGVYDEDDKCPNKAGVIDNKGCPERVDSDGDGIHDGKDKCPNLAGVSANNGCPSDVDSDGVYDANDKCPNKFGPKSNNGCPEIKLEEEEKAFLTQAMKSVEFATGSANLKGTSNKTLDRIANMLEKYPRYKLAISGHTDNTSNAESNMTLSKNRAKACYDYLISKGINERRITSNGFGQTTPIATNDTPEGRQKNRRVEFKLSFWK